MANFDTYDVYVNCETGARIVIIKEPDGENIPQEKYQQVITDSLVEELNIGIIDGTLNIFDVSKTVNTYDNNSKNKK